MPYHQHLGHIGSQTNTIASRLTQIELLPEGVVHVAVDEAPELQPLTDRLLAELGPEALPSIYQANHTVRYHVTLCIALPSQLERARAEFLGARSTFRRTCTSSLFRPKRRTGAGDRRQGGAQMSLVEAYRCGFTRHANSVGPRSLNGHAAINQRIFGAQAFHRSRAASAIPDLRARAAA